MNTKVCSKCKTLLSVDTSCVLTVIPPKYKAIYPKCGHVEYISTNEFITVGDIMSEHTTRPILTLNEERPFIAEPTKCFHEYEVKILDKLIVTFCKKCGKIGDIKQDGLTLNYL